MNAWNGPYGYRLSQLRVFPQHGRTPSGPIFGGSRGILIFRLFPARRCRNWRPIGESSGCSSMEKQAINRSHWAGKVMRGASRILLRGESYDDGSQYPGADQSMNP